MPSPSSTPTCAACCTASSSARTCPNRPRKNRRYWPSPKSWSRPGQRRLDLERGGNGAGGADVYGGKPHCEACPLSGRCRARTRIVGALAAAPRAPKGETAYKYEDSNRFWRGRVLARLREAPEEGVSLRELGAALREGFGEGDLDWIRTVVESLEKDGLAVVYEQRPHDNRAEAVAEIRPVYGTEREVRREESARLPDGETRVSLP